MSWNWFEELLGKNMKKLSLWIKDEKLRFAISVCTLLILTFVVIPKILSFISDYDYGKAILSILQFIYFYSNSKPFSTILLIFLIVTFLLVFFLYRKIGKRMININPEKEPELWSFYKGSGWYIVDDIASWNKVLKITNCNYPTILKFGQEWINYNLSFQVKVPSSVPERNRNFTFVVRAKDKSNNVFLQCKPDGVITPHLLADGIFIVDDENQIDFLAQYPIDEWFDVKVLVRGENVTIKIMGQSATYKIPSERFVLSSEHTDAVMNLSHVIEKNIRREGSVESSSQGSSGMPVFVLNLDYEAGTIGFREWRVEAALYRKIQIELKHPFYN